MDTQSVETRVKSVFASLFPIEVSSITATTGPEQIETWDSLNHMSLVSGLESEFQISFDVEEIMQMENVGATISIVRGKLGELA